MAKRSLRMVCCLAAVLALAGCGKKSTSGGSIKRAAVKSEEVQFASPQNGDTVAVFDTSLGEVRAVLYPQYAPMAVENFVGLSQAGYYNETVLFRVEPGFAVEGGDASGEGTGGTTIWNGNVWLIPVGVLVILLGHALNISLALMGVLVHERTLRMI